MGGLKKEGTWKDGYTNSQRLISSAAQFAIRGILFCHEAKPCSIPAEGCQTGNAIAQTVLDQ